MPDRLVAPNAESGAFPNADTPRELSALTTPPTPNEAGSESEAVKTLSEVASPRMIAAVMGASPWQPEGTGGVDAKNGAAEPSTGRNLASETAGQLSNQTNQPAGQLSTEPANLADGAKPPRGRESVSAASTQVLGGSRELPNLGIIEEIHGGPRSERVRRHVRSLEGGQPRFNLAEAAEMTGMPPESVRRVWLSLGYPTIVNEEDPVFTDLDIVTLAKFEEVVDEGALDEVAINALLRASSHTAERLLLWQQETLVELAGKERGLGPLEARAWVLDHFMDYERLLQDMLIYSWRRQLANLIRHTEVEVTQLEEHRNVDSLELNRAIGFIDLVSFTNRTERLAPGKFMELIEVFDYTCRDVISSAGGRVVKTMGDAFLFVTDDVVTGANVVCDINDALGAIPEMPAVRSSLTWGPILARFGDVFGAPVNLASRLADVASPGTILTSKQVSKILDLVAGDQFMMINVGSPQLQGLGEVEVVEIRRSRPTGMNRALSDPLLRDDDRDDGRDDW